MWPLIGCSQPASAPKPTELTEAPTNKSRWGWAEPKFSPKGGCTEQLVKAIGMAKKSIKVLSYSFTSEPIADALVVAHKRGVVVEVVFDRSDPTGKGDRLKDLTKAGIPCWVDRKHAIAHNKVLIIDEEVVFTGSFNFTTAAEDNNAENSVPILKPEWVKLYSDNFALHKGHSEKVK